MVVRPERIVMETGTDRPTAVNAVPGTVIQDIYFGSSRKVEVRLQDGSTCLVRESAGSITAVGPGQQIWLTFAPENAAVLPADPA